MSSAAAAAPRGQQQLCGEDCISCVLDESYSSLHSESRNGADMNEAASKPVPSLSRASMEVPTVAADRLPFERSNVVENYSKEEDEEKLSHAILLKSIEGDKESSRNDEKKGILDGEFTEADVLTVGGNSGRNTYKFHVGNKKFRALAQSHAADYALAKTENRKDATRKIAQKVVDTVKAYGGRFLEMGDITNMWHTMGDKQVIYKTQRALQQAVKEADFESAKGEMPSVPDNDVTEWDVLCGNAFASRPGNKSYSALIQANAAEYIGAKGRAKSEVVKKIVTAIHANGRFLEKDGATGMWQPIGFEQALAKTRKALGNVSRKQASKNEAETCPRVKKDDVTDWDVLATLHNSSCFKGHPGNMKFLALIEAFCDEYVHAVSKVAVSRKVISAVHANNGRFLKKDGNSDDWIVVTDKAAIKKVGNAFMSKRRKMIQIAPSIDSLELQRSADPINTTSSFGKKTRSSAGVSSGHNVGDKVNGVEDIIRDCETESSIKLLQKKSSSGQILSSSTLTLDVGQNCSRSTFHPVGATVSATSRANHPGSMTSVHTPANQDTANIGCQGVKRKAPEQSTLKYAPAGKRRSEKSVFHFGSNEPAAEPPVHPSMKFLTDYAIAHGAFQRKSPRDVAVLSSPTADENAPVHLMHFVPSGKVAGQQGKHPCHPGRPVMTWKMRDV